MTIRDKVRELYPEAIDEQYEGGVKGCPDDFPELEQYCLHGGVGCSVDDDCEACWSQEYQEPEPEKKPFDWSLVSMVSLGVAVFELFVAGFYLLNGESDKLRFCCLMGMLCLIAAKLWREK